MKSEISLAQLPLALSQKKLCSVNNVIQRGLVTSTYKMGTLSFKRDKGDSLDLVPPVIFLDNLVPEHQIYHPGFLWDNRKHIGPCV